MIKKPLQWHPAFQAVLQIEFSKDAEYLEFIKEYPLGDKPLQLDTLVLKKNSGVVLKKTMGRLFRTYNIIEYKSPDDYLSINDFYKVSGYTCIYQSNTERVAEIPPEELTMTLVSSRYPRELLRHLKSVHKATVRREYPGIYYVQGLMFPLQIVIAGKLPEEDYIWLSRLRKNLRVREDMEPLALAYRGKDKNPLYMAAMDLIVRANRKQTEEGLQMCEALRELFEDELLEREERGVERGLERGKAEDVLELLSELGEVPESLRDIVLAQRNLVKLSTWLKMAAKVESVESFVAKMN